MAEKCSYCGAEIAENSRFCAQCGAEVVLPIPPPSPRYDPEAAAHPEPSPQAPKKGNNKAAKKAKPALSNKTLLVIWGALLAGCLILACLVTYFYTLGPGSPNGGFTLNKGKAKTSTAVKTSAIVKAARTATTVPTSAASRLEPTRANTPAAPFNYFTGEEIYANNFNDGEGDYELYDGTNCVKKVEAGKYRIDVNKEQWECNTYSPDVYNDFSITADISSSNGDENNGGGGFIFRFQDEQNYYTAEVGSDGYYSIFKLVDDKWVTVVDYTYTKVILPAGKTNKVDLVARGSNIALMVNGSLLATAKDDTFSEGKVGVVCSTYKGTSVNTCRFDNIRIHAVK